MAVCRKREKMAGPSLGHGLCWPLTQSWPATMAPSFLLLLLAAASTAPAAIVPLESNIQVDLTTADCLYAETTEPISIQFFVLEGRDVIEKSEKFPLTRKGDLMARGETRSFHLKKSAAYCRTRKVCTNLSFVGIFVGDRAVSDNEEFDTWNTNNITVTFQFDNQINSFNFDFSTEGACIRPLHFWSADYWHRYGPLKEFEERSEEYSVGDLVINPTYIFI